MSNILMKWLFVTASIFWALIVIDQVVIDAGPDDARPVIQAGKNCTSEDMHQRYECTEAAILSHQREKFARYIGVGLLLFGPPIGLWMGLNRLARANPVNLRSDRRPPSISRWRVR